MYLLLIYLEHFEKAIVPAASYVTLVLVPPNAFQPCVVRYGNLSETTALMLSEKHMRFQSQNCWATLHVTSEGYPIAMCHTYMMLTRLGY